MDVQKIILPTYLPTDLPTYPFTIHNGTILIGRLQSSSFTPSFINIHRDEPRLEPALLNTLMGFHNQPGGKTLDCVRKPIQTPQLHTESTPNQ